MFRSFSIFIFTILFIKLIGLTGFPDKVFPKINLFFSKSLYGFTAGFNKPAGDVFYTVLGIAILLFIIFVLYLLIKKNYAGFRKQITAMFYFLSVFYLIFYLIWGFNYYKIRLNDKFDTELESVDELKEMAEMYFARALKYRAEVKENEKGAFVATISDEELKNEIEKAADMIKDYPEIKFSAYLKPNLKPSSYSGLASYIGISGYYNPFTNEGNYNALEPDTRRVFAKLHETAHQFGFADESEASMVGFLLGVSSENYDLLYACNFKAMRSLLNRILWFDPAYVKDFVENKYTYGMKMDREYEIEFDQQYDNASDDAFALMNEAFLRLNNQEGLKSYGRFVELLVGFNRKYRANP